jgi:hypothetical protein
MRISKKSMLGVFCLLGMFVAGFLWGGIAPANVDIVPGVQAQANNSSGSRRCSTRTLNGAYGIKFEGQKLSEGPFVSVSRITFDGEGQFTTNEIGRFNGNLVQRTFTEPYTVNDDCTGFLDFSSTLSIPPHQAHGNFVIVNQGQEFFVIDNEDGWAASGVGKKL